MEGMGGRLLRDGKRILSKNDLGEFHLPFPCPSRIERGDCVVLVEHGRFGDHTSLSEMEDAVLELKVIYERMRGERGRGTVWGVRHGGECDECLGVWKKEGFERIDWGG